MLLGCATPAEVKAHMHTAELEHPVLQVAEVVRQPRKKHSDIGFSRKRKTLPVANKENDRLSNEPRKPS